jgi:hypothetical protein
MQAKRNNINTHLFATALAAWLGLLVVGVPSQANAKTLVKIEAVKARASAADFVSLSTSEEVDVTKRLPLHRLVSTFQNFISDFTLKMGQSQSSNDLAIGFYSLLKAQTFAPQFANPTKYSSQKVSTSNNRVLVVTNLPRASL